VFRLTSRTGTFGLNEVGPSKIIDSHGNPHSLDLWDFTIAVNLTGTFNLTRLALPHLISVNPEGPDGERGVIIFVSSSAAVRRLSSSILPASADGGPAQFEGQPGQTAYAASKGALNSMVLPLARDLGRHGVRVVSIAPGPFASPMTVGKLPPKAETALLREVAFPARFGLPRDFAQTVRWIVDCAYVNGETVRLSGAGRMPGRL
jgi:3-hydroxyacyl-CoA dehydrogenase/3-hydroxy-2-methylbutyryl-CoA dehydrogenase